MIKVNDSLVLPGERVDDLLIKDLKVIQSPRDYCFSIDAVLLANFAAVKPGEKVMDLGTGCGVIPLLLSAKTRASAIYGLEVRPEQADRAARSVRLNGLSDRVHILEGDIRQVKAHHRAGSFDVVVTNPPYRAVGSGKLNTDPGIAVARHEVLCTIADVVKAAAWLLNPKGRFYIVYRPQRMVELFCLLRSAEIELKKLRLVHPAPGKAANMLLAEAVKHGEPGLDVLPPLTVYGADGRYTAELNEIYFGAGGD